MLTEHIAASISRFTVVTCKVKSTDVSPPTADAGHEVLFPSLVQVRRVGFACADQAPGDPLPTLLVPAAVTLLQKVASFLDIVVTMAGVTGAKTVLFSRVRGSIGRGRVGGCIHVIGRLAEARFGDWGQRFSRGLWGRGVGGRGWVVVGIGGVEGVPMVSISVALKIRVTGFIIVCHGRKGVFIGEFKGGGGMSGAGEAVNFGFKGFPWVVIGFRGWRRGWLWGFF
jgi:hypothetical protein